MAGKGKGMEEKQVMMNSIGLCLISKKRGTGRVIVPSIMLIGSVACGGWVTYKRMRKEEI